VHDRISDLLSAAERTPVGLKGVGAGEVSPDAASQGAPPGLPRFLSMGEHTATIDNLRELEAYCRQTSLSGSIPLTFATWWESGKRVPDGYFEIVMRVRPPQPTTMTVAGAEEAVTTLVVDIQAALARNARDAENERLHRGLGGFHSSAVASLKSAEYLTGEEFRRAMADSSERIQGIGDKIRAISQAVPPEESARLEGLSRRCEQLSEELSKLHHPRVPVARRSVTAAASTAAATAGGGVITTERPPQAPAREPERQAPAPREGVSPLPDRVEKAASGDVSRRRPGGMAWVIAAWAVLLAGIGWFWYQHAARAPAPRSAPLIAPEPRPATTPAETGARAEATLAGAAAVQPPPDPAAQWILSHRLDGAHGFDGITLAVLAIGYRQALGISEIKGKPRSDGGETGLDPTGERDVAQTAGKGPRLAGSTEGARPMAATGDPLGVDAPRISGSSSANRETNGGTPDSQIDKPQSQLR
jgi:hypothetical protein